MSKEIVVFILGKSQQFLKLCFVCLSVCFCCCFSVEVDDFNPVKTYVGVHGLESFRHPLVYDPNVDTVTIPEPHSKSHL